jgi:hypothetical protein
MANDNIQHGIDNNSSNDAEKGAALGGLGGAAVGAAAGSLAGPLGTIVGAVAGGLMGAGASGAAVAAVDQIDNDNSVSGVAGRDNIRSSSDDSVIETGVGGHNVVTGGPATSENGNAGLAGGAIAGGLLGAAVGGPIGAVVGGTLGSLAGGAAGDAAEAADDNANLAAATSYSGAAFQANAAMGTNPMGTGIGTNLDPTLSGIQSGATGANDDVLAPSSQTDYRSVDNGVTSIGSTDQNADQATLTGLGTPGVRFGDDVGNVEAGGVTTQGADTNSSLGKGDDSFTGDRADDKTGQRVLNDHAGR